MVVRVMQPPLGNRVLDALPDAVLTEVVESLVPVAVVANSVVFDAMESVDALYFPVDAVVALVVPFPKGVAIEVATIGNDGIVGIPAAEAACSLVRAVVVVGGQALRMPTDAFIRAMKRTPTLSHLVSVSTQRLFDDMSRAVACNRAHANDQRLSRWVRMTRDRLDRDDFAIAAELLAPIVGSSGTAAMQAVGRLERKGLIEYRRGHLTVIDPQGLARAACECYRVVPRMGHVASSKPSPA